MIQFGSQSYLVVDEVKVHYNPTVRRRSTGMLRNYDNKVFLCVRVTREESNLSILHVVVKLCIELGVYDVRSSSSSRSRQAPID